VGSVLLEQVLRLAPASRRALLRALEGSLQGEDLAAHILDVVERRRALAGTAPSGAGVMLTDFVSQRR